MQELFTGMHLEFSNFYPHYIHMHVFQIPFKFRSKKGGILDGDTQIWPMLSKQQRPITGSQSH